MFKPQLKLTKAAVQELADGYMAGLSDRDKALEEAVMSRFHARKGRMRRLSMDELKLIGEWKTPRSKPLIASNDAGFVEEATAVAFAKSSGCRLRIEVLTLLSGVCWPTASVILHLCHANEYPILDVNALAALGISSPGTGPRRGFCRLTRYQFDFWRDYTAFARQQCARLNLGMRTLDRALWQRGKELTASR